MDNQSTINGGSKPRAMSVPPERPFLSFNSKPVGIAATWSNWALCHKFRPIGPARSHLPNTMPNKNTTAELNAYHCAEEMWKVLRFDLHIIQEIILGYFTQIKNK